MSEHKHIDFLLKLVYWALGAAAVWLFLRFILPWLLPFLLAFGLAWLLERPVTFLMKKFHLKRWIAAALCTAGLIALLCGGLGLVLWRVGYELALLLRRLPFLLAGLPTVGKTLENWAYRFLVALPVQLQDFFATALDEAIRQGIGLPNRFYDGLLSALGKAAAAVPNALFFGFTTALATYFSSASRPALMDFFRRQIPEGWRRYLDEGKQILKGAFGSWLRAQGLLMVFTFFLLAVGFFVLQVDLALLLAALIAILDALPVFGTGTVLVPWAIVAMLGGKWNLAVGLAVIYGLAFLLRGLLEPRLVGHRVGLHPLAALFAMYVGLSVFGVWGMILSPLVAIFLKQLHDSGLLKLWKSKG